MEVDSNAQIHEIKASYYRLARIYHPDRMKHTVPEDAQEKFNELRNAYCILSNPDTKLRYDGGERDNFKGPTNTQKWEQYMRIVDASEVEYARQNYQESAIIREFVHGKGSITHIFNTVPFMRLEDEGRIIQIIKHCIELGKLPKMIIKKMRH